MIDPAFTMAAYDPLITVCLEKMPFLTVGERAALRELIQRALEHMMSLPASSTHHHRSAGGLFYHSLETAALVPEEVIAGHSAFNPVESILIAGFVVGLLHDVGKVVSSFHVYPQSADIQDVGFGYLEEPEMAAQRWNPHAESLWAWSQREGVTHLAIPYQRSAEIGHEAAATNGFWRRFVPEEVFDRRCCKSHRLSEQPLSPFVSGHAFDFGGADGVEAVHQCDADMDFGGLAVWVT